MTLTLLAILAWAVIQGPTPSPSPPLPSQGQDQIREPKKLKNVSPDYPREAKRAGLMGSVVLECTIDIQGNVSDARALSGVPPLTDAAIKAVKQWRYTPTLLKGSAVPVIMTVTINFHVEPHFQLSDLLDSLKSRNEFIRESAVLCLGKAGVDFETKRRIVQRLKDLVEQDESERVRVAAWRSSFSSVA
jgi:TonB family protein